LRLANAPHFEQGIFLEANLIFKMHEAVSASMPAYFMAKNKQ